MLLILLQFFLCRMFLLGHGRLLGLYVVYVYWLFLFFPFFSLVAFLLLLFVSFIIFVVCLPFFCCCDFYFFAFCEHGHANLWFNILFSYLFFRLFFLGCSIGVVGKGNGGMYGEFTHLYIRKFKVLWNFNLTHLLCVTITWCVFV